MKLENLRSKFRYSDAFRVFAFLIVKMPFADSFMNFQFSHVRLAVSFMVTPRLGICMSFFVSRAIAVLDKDFQY